MADVLRSGWLGSGELVGVFERAVAERSGYQFAIATTSGTTALHVALAVSGIGVGDEVLVPSFTYCATVQAIVATGARPVFVDVDDRTLCLDLEHAAGLVGPRTRGLAPVYYGGHTAAAAELAAFAAVHGLVLVEDAAHAFGAPHSGVDSGPSARCFSFGPIKPFTCGQGGAVVTDDPEFAERVRAAADLGIVRDPAGAASVVAPGFRYRMHDLNASIGVAQLARFDEIVSVRREILGHYDRELAALEGDEVRVHRAAATVPFAVTVRVPADRRAAVRAALAADGIETTVNYPPNHRQPAFAAWSAADLPVTETAASEVISLPFHLGIGAADVGRVVEALAAAVAVR